VRVSLQKLVWIGLPGFVRTATRETLETARDMWVVDLTELAPFPSLFDEQRRHLRAGIAFLCDFVKDLAKPIKKDGREHIDYVPTQVVTEYLRHAFRAEGGYRVKGVIYQSARKGQGKCCVLFARNKACCETTPGWQADKKNRLGLVATARHDYNSPRRP
jgi:RES domain-containing protein